MASIRKRTLPSKTVVWQVDYKDGAGKRRHKQFTTRKSADEWLVTARADVASGTHVADSSSITVAEASDLWIKKCKSKNLEQTTLDAYEQHVELHIKPLVGKTKLSRLTTADIETFYETLLENGRTPDMVRRVRINFGAILAYAQMKDLVGKNVVRLTPFKVSNRNDKRPSVPTIDEVKRLLAKVTLDWLAFLYVALFAGLRASELRGLPWRNVDFKRSMITVDQRADKWGRIGPPKSRAGTRDIPLPPVAMKALKDWKPRCPQSHLDLVFPTRVGTPQSHANIMGRFFRPLQIAANVSKVTKVAPVVDKSGPVIAPAKTAIKAKYGLHALRHFFASVLIDADCSAKKVQTLLGHASIVQTYDIYGHLFERRERDRQVILEIQKKIVG